MNALKKLLLVIASAGVAGSAPALTQINPGTLSPAIKRPADAHRASSAALPFSLAAALNFAVDGNYRTATTGAAGQAPARTGAQPTRVAGLKLDPISALSLPPANGSADGARVDLQAARAPGDSSARRERRSGGVPRDGLRLPQAAVPEPDKWTKLLCGLVVVGFMARRRTNPAAV